MPFPNRKYYAATYFFTIIAIVLYCIPMYAQKVSDARYNRFQYHKFKWRTFHTDAFHIYFTAGNDSLCAFIAREYSFASEKVKRNIGTSLLRERNIIIYPSTDQLYESNIGLAEPEHFTLPTFVLKGNRLLLTYNGSYEELRSQLYESIARNIWEANFKEDLRDQVAGTVVADNIPSWFKEGVIRYFAHKWSIVAEDALKRSFRENNFQNWLDVIKYQPGLSGQAFCYFLADQYYLQAVSNLFFQLKKKKKLERAIRLIAKKSLDSLYIECFSFYRQRFGDTTKSSIENAEITAIEHRKGMVRNILISQAQDRVAYILQSKGKRTVYVYDVKTAKNSKIASYNLPPWIDDHSKDIYPIINWHTDKRSLIVAMPIKGKVAVKHYGASGDEIEKNTLFGIDGIKSLSKVSNREYLLSAFRKGQGDIVQYDIPRELYTPLTNDKYDDGQPHTGSDGSVYFLSHRPDRIEKADTLKSKQGIYQVKGKEIKPVQADSAKWIRWDKLTPTNTILLATHTRFGTERFATINHAHKVTTLAEYKPFQYLEGNEIAFFRTSKDSLFITKQLFDDWAAKNTNNDTTSAWLTDYRKREAEEAKEDSILNATRSDQPSFLEGVLKPKNAKQLSEERADSIYQSQQYHPKKVKPYILQLHSAYFSARVNNDYFINRYQPYLNYQGQFKFPEVGGMAQGGFTDLFENHHINIAFRLPAGTEGSDFFVKYENTARKADWGLTYFRKVESVKPDPQRNWKHENGRTYPSVAKVKTNYYEASLHYPLSYYLSAGLQTAVRNDRTIFLATDRYSLNFADIKSVWSISTLSLKLNKLKPTVPLLSKGYEGKILLDVFKGFTQQEAALMGSGIQLSHHLPLYKYITLVTQAQLGYSDGDQYMLYNLGGVDNNLTVRMDSNVHFSQLAPYAFQTLITPFRGHLQNRMYGNSYAVFNADVYFPLFQPLIPIETPLNFINLLQPGIFADAGTAKETWTKPVVNNGWLWSYGFSLRTSLAGYPLRFDIAWPGNFDKSPLWYLSLNIE